MELVIEKNYSSCFESLDENKQKGCKSMARKRFYRKPSKFEEEAMLIESEIIEIIEQNVEYSDCRLKTVFKCKSQKIPDGRLCIQWGRTCFEVGATIQAKGRIVNNNGKEVFLVWSSMITKRPERALE